MKNEIINVEVCKFKTHPFSKEVFEDLSDEDYTALKNDIKKNDVRIPVEALPDFTLIDGHQRLKIAKDLGLRTLPCIVKNLSEDEAKQWIITANLLRRHLTPRQRAIAIAKLSKLFEVGRGSNPRDEYGQWTEEAKFASSDDVIEKTAQITGIKPRTVILYRTYARAIAEIPELKGLDSINSVVIEYGRRREIKARKEKFKGNLELKNLILGNAFEKIEEIEDGSVDLLLTDPPYGTAYRTCRGETEKLRGKEWSTIIGDDVGFFEKFAEFLPKLKTKLKTDAHIYVFTSWKAWHQLYSIVSKHFDIKNCIVWDKGYPALGELTGYNYRDVYELILFASNIGGKRKLNWKGWGELNEPKPTNIIRCTSSKRSSKTFMYDYHPAIKPIELLKRLISFSTVENELVLDPFAGSGSTLVAAEELDRNWIGIEIDPKWYEMAKARIHELRQKRIQGGETDE